MDIKKLLLKNNLLLAEAALVEPLRRSNKPYTISFVINRDGKILDGDTLEYAFHEIDSLCDTAPTGYMINCSYPSFLNADKQPSSIYSRLIGFIANASSLDQTELE